MLKTFRQKWLHWLEQCTIQSGRRIEELKILITLITDILHILYINRHSPFVATLSLRNWRTYDRWHGFILTEKWCLWSTTGWQLEFLDSASPAIPIESLGGFTSPPSPRTMPAGHFSHSHSFLPKKKSIFRQYHRWWKALFFPSSWVIGICASWVRNPCKHLWFIFESLVRTFLTFPLSFFKTPVLFMTCLWSLSWKICIFMTNRGIRRCKGECCIHPIFESLVLL